MILTTTPFVERRLHTAAAILAVVPDLSDLHTLAVHLGFYGLVFPKDPRLAALRIAVEVEDRELDSSLQMALHFLKAPLQESQTPALKVPTPPEVEATITLARRYIEDEGRKEEDARAAVGVYKTQGLYVVTMLILAIDRLRA